MIDVTVIDQFGRPVPNDVVWATANIPVPAPGQSPITSVSIRADGTMLVNGREFFPISAQKMDYVGWGAAGYTTAQADAKLTSLTNSGVNTVMGNYGDTMPDQIIQMWNSHTCYWLGSATLAPNQGGNAYLWGDTVGLTNLQSVIGARAYPNLLSWTVATELNPQVVWATQTFTATPSASGGSLGGTFIYTIVPLNAGGGWVTPTSIEQTVTVTGPNGSVALSWSTFGGGVGNYEVWRATTSGQSTTRYVVTGATSFTDTGAAGTAGFAHANQYAYANVTRVIQANDLLKRPQGDVEIYDTNFEQFLTTTLVRYSRAELQSLGPIVIRPDGTTGEYTALPVQQIYNAADSLRRNTSAGCLPGMSLTAWPELSGPYGNYPVPPDDYPRPFYGIRRCYFISIACGCKAVEMLWGPNQRGGQWQNNGDVDLNAHFPALNDSIFPNHLQALSQLAAFAPVITAQGTWTQVSTVGGGFTFPPFQTSTQSNVFLLQGLYAAKKQVGATLWVIAVNLVQAVAASTDPTYPNQAVDQTLTGATINVGQTINTCTRWSYDPTQGPVSFAGSTITDNFTPGEVHIYQVT